jgi:hypothetical protein
MGTEYGGEEEVLDEELSSRLSWEKSVSVGEMVERKMHVATKSGEITERGERKREGKYGKAVKI